MCGRFPRLLANPSALGAGVTALLARATAMATRLRVDRSGGPRPSASPAAAALSRRLLHREPIDFPRFAGDFPF